MLHYYISHKSIVLYDLSDLNMWKMKMFVNTSTKNKDSVSNLCESGSS